MPQLNPIRGSIDNYANFRPLSTLPWCCSKSNTMLPERPNIRCGRALMLSMWRALVVPLLSVSFAGQAGTIGVSNDNQLEKQEIHPSFGDTYDDEIANRIAQEVLKKTTRQGWLLSSSVTDCYNEARQTTRETKSSTLLYRA